LIAETLRRSLIDPPAAKPAIVPVVAAVEA